MKETKLKPSQGLEFISDIVFNSAYYSAKADLEAMKIEIRCLCCNEEMYDEAIEYCRATTWSYSQMIEYISATGKIPQYESAKYPEETITFAKYGFFK